MWGRGTLSLMHESLGLNWVGAGSSYLASCIESVGPVVDSSHADILWLGLVSQTLSRAKVSWTIARDGQADFAYSRWI